jgi:hypothetical protein
MKINFTFSAAFERSLLHLASEEAQSAFTVEEMNKKIEILDLFWSTKGKGVEECLRKITGLSFKESETDCYINSKISVSHPFCIRWSDDERMKDTVVHEIIHKLFKQNSLSSTPKMTAYKDLYKSEHVLTSNHILLHAVHFLLVKELFPDRSEAIQKMKNPHYARAWSIVNEIGAQKLVDKYLK